ncbi:c-type cytochrome [Cognatishimia activa]|uniref:Cytochrome c2 n=1 Tax=Cognatishimia activa TaxID=1715691 RepID=A0A0P1ITF2_9RHOB|nr:c-type cytochrome [Cognatishimia activa]CUI81108.1 Cytochrome c2 [Cognatishimia activa]CUK26897.1 Cytochrome c2 [Cognatishimia activa]
MSKSPNILVPALGGTALVLGVAYGLSSREHGDTEIELLQDRVEQVLVQADDARAQAATEVATANALKAEIEDVRATAALQVASGGSLTQPAPRLVESLGLGREAHQEEIAAWDVDVLPDGRGLPPGKGDVYTGEEVFATYCAACHGDFAEGVDNWPVLAGGFDTLADKDPVKTVGSYWPYLSTVWDYVHRSMPFGGAQTLTDDEVYAIVAYILYSNDLVDDDFELSHENFMDVEMHNADGFVVEGRDTEEYPIWRDEPCMSDCKDSVDITMRASVLDVTPETEEEGEDDAALELPQETPSTTTVQEAPVIKTAAVATPDPELAAAGKKVFRKCQSCHAVGEGAKHKTGPVLNNVLGSQIASVDGFKYSNALTEAGAAGGTWDAETLAAFLENPKKYLKGTKMAFAGLKRKEDQEAVAAYLATFLGNPG